MIILMGSATDAAREAIDYLNANGQKVGMISVQLYRPFSVKHLLAAVPKTAHVAESLFHFVALFISIRADSRPRVRRSVRSCVLCLYVSITALDFLAAQPNVL